MTKDEALKLALEELENCADLLKVFEAPIDSCVGATMLQAEAAITAIKQARALDKMAENARELGLDYEPADGTQVSKVWWDGEKLMAKPIPLVDFYQPVQDSTCNETLRAQDKAYPRTCKKCGEGPCIGAPKQPPAAQPAPVQEPVGIKGYAMALNEVALQLRDRYKTDLLSTPLWAEFEKARNKFASSVAAPPKQPAPVQEPVQEPEIVQRVKRYAGQTMRTARNPNITARECIELANWIAKGQPAAQPAVPLTDEQINAIRFSIPTKAVTQRDFELARAIESAHGIREKGQP
jgi:hypothetical protein